MHSPFDDFKALVGAGEGPNLPQKHAMEQDLNQKAIAPDQSIYRVMTWLAAWQKEMPVIAREMHICLFATAYDAATPVPALRAFMEAARRGAAPVNILAQDHGLGLRVLDMATDHPHKPFEWSEKACAAAMAFGMEALAAGGDILALGDTGFGNDAFALAVSCAVLRASADVNDLLFAPEKPVHEQAAALLAGVPDDADPLECVRLVGGPDIAAGVGALLASRATGQAVLIEGAALLAAAVVLKGMDANSLDHVMLASCRSKADSMIAAMIGLTPVLAEDPGAGPGAGLAQAHRVIMGAVSIQALRAPRLH